MQRLSPCLVLLLAACMGWRPEPTSPADLLASQKPDVVRITQSDSSRLILREPTVRGDTLYGRPQANLEADPEERTGIPLSEVMGIATLRSDPTKTTLLVVGVAVTTFASLCAAETLLCAEEPDFLTALTGPK